LGDVETRPAASLALLLAAPLLGHAAYQATADVALHVSARRAGSLLRAPHPRRRLGSTRRAVA